ncbi:MAG: thioredoxin family protein [Chloroflexota bacterium]|jgi:thioredoxin-like negative regulator of GroEL
MTPIVDGLSAEFEGRAAVIKLNAVEPANEGLQARYNVRGHPSFVVLDGDGRAVQRFFGPQTEDLLRQALKDVTGAG